MIYNAHEFVAAETNVLVGVNRDSFRSTIDALEEIGFETFVDAKKTSHFHAADTVFIVPCLDKDDFDGVTTLVAMGLVGILKPVTTSIIKFNNEDYLLIGRTEATMTLCLSWADKK